ncbi:hypothetical protein ACFOY2_14745 [Nonomuraea purpurea]|uniref:Uncharacterized protein n=1 Tax=Nonomuraea purpurea TaxID=1849276 RepID=A0ABV8G7A0_9ACTN
MEPVDEAGVESAFAAVGPEDGRDTSATRGAEAGSVLPEEPDRGVADPALSSSGVIISRMSVAVPMTAWETPARAMSSSETGCPVMMPITAAATAPPVAPLNALRPAACSSIIRAVLSSGPAPLRFSATWVRLWTIDSMASLKPSIAALPRSILSRLPWTTCIPWTAMDRPPPVAKSTAAYRSMFCSNFW